jgi:hypothetical protein
LSVVVSVLVVVAMDMQARACTAVFVSAGGAVLVGNNEDASMPLSKVWVVPGEGGKYSRLCIGYAGDTTVQGGVNEKGLWFDSFSVEAKPVAASPGQKVFDGDMHDKIMAECATVEEAVALLRRYSNPFLSDNMLMLGDRTGASAIVEGSAVLPRSRPPGGPCSDYLLLHLRPAEHEAVSLRLPQLRERRRPGCAAGAGEGEAQPEPTGALPDHVCRRGVRLPVRRRPGDQENGSQVPKFDPKTYPQFVGRYVVSSPEAMAGVTVVVTAGTDRLLAELSDGNVRELIPESSTRFSVWEPDRRGTFVTFLRDQAGKVTGFVADTTGGEISATKTK